MITVIFAFTWKSWFLVEISRYQNAALWLVRSLLPFWRAWTKSTHIIWRTCAKSAHILFCIVVLMSSTFVEAATLSINTRLVRDLNKLFSKSVRLHSPNFSFFQHNYQLSFILNRLWAQSDAKSICVFRLSQRSFIASSFASCILPSAYGWVIPSLTVNFSFSRPLSCLKRLIQFSGDVRLATWIKGIRSSAAPTGHLLADNGVDRKIWLFASLVNGRGVVPLAKGFSIVVCQ